MFSQLALPFLYDSWSIEQHRPPTPANRNDQVLMLPMRRAVSVISHQAKAASNPLLELVTPPTGGDTSAVGAGLPDCQSPPPLPGPGLAGTAGTAAPVNGAAGRARSIGGATFYASVYWDVVAPCALISYLTLGPL